MEMFVVVIAVIYLEYRIKQMRTEQQMNFEAVQLKLAALLKAGKIEIANSEIPEIIKKEVRLLLSKSKDIKAQELIEKTFAVDSKTAAQMMMKVKDPLFAMAAEGLATKKEKES